MSRVDEAMRRAAATAPLAEDSNDARTIGKRQGAAATLERFRVEGRSRGSVPSGLSRAPAPMPTSPRRDGIRSVLDATVAAQNAKLVICPDMAHVPVTQYRRLAAALHEMQLERGLKVVMVSSAVPHEGKTLTITNLALTLSEAYHRQVLLIDADLRRPCIHQLFGAPQNPGLADVLAHSGPLPLVQVSPYLKILTAGKGDINPLAQLTSDRLQAVVGDAAAQGDWVLLDTPPVSLLPDAQHVASVSEGVVFVIAAGTTPYPSIQRAIATIGAERILGTVLNGVDGRVLLERDQYEDYFTPVQTLETTGGTAD
jgi:capsular exopolysaccharide synthesis family protein